MTHIVNERFAENIALQAFARMQPGDTIESHVRGYAPPYPTLQSIHDDDGYGLNYELAHV